MKKILVTGCLGYLGSEICELLSGFSWKYDIHGIDKKFLSLSVSRLRVKNIKFDQIDILDEIKIKRFLIKNKFDVVIHLAGITDVAYTKFEANSKQENLIKKTALEGTRNILKNLNKNAQIIFPSTHVVFNGLDKVKKNIDEDSLPKAILSYSINKLKNEKQIKSSGLKYVIFRLGSVYGLSNDSMRIKIMPNYFSFLASQNKNISVFGNGSQFKSLVSVKDVARAFLHFIGWSNNDIFNLTNEQLTVKQVAKIAKKFAKNKIKINYTKDEVPNRGYTLSNLKIKKAGFRFLYNLNYSIKEMIENWSEKKIEKSLEYKFQGSDNYVDKRGLISNYKLDEGVNLIGYIESKKNSIRANHYHPVQEQKCLLIKGRYVSIIKDLTDANSLKITKIVNEGDMVITRPNVAHTMVFLKDSIFLNLVPGEREHKNYGITHTIPSKIISEEDAKDICRGYNFRCRICNNIDLLRLINLGYQPLANDYKIDANKNSKFPLELNFCKKCLNGQLSFNVKKETLFKEYDYQSSSAKPLVDHFNKFAENLEKKFRKNKNKLRITEIGSNDGIFLNQLKKFGFKNLTGVEPAKNLCKNKNYQNVKVINDFCTKRILKKVHTKSDIIFAANVFAHSDNILEMAETMISMISNNGTIILEVQYLIDTLRKKTFDNIYHEHFNYWSVKSICIFFKNLNAEVFKIEQIPTHGGSIRVYVRKKKIIKFNNKITKVIKNEEIILKKKKILLDFENQVKLMKKNFINKINFLRKKYKKIIGFGAPAKASTLLNYFNYNNFFDYFVEDNKLKVGKYLPGTSIKINEVSLVKKETNACVIVFAWNYYRNIKTREELKNHKTINLIEILSGK